MRLLLSASLLTASTICVVAPVARGQEDRGAWPRWRGTRFDGTAVTGANVFARPFNLKVRWTARVGAGYSGIAIADGHVVTLGSDGKSDSLVALTADQGREAWRVRLAETYPARDGSTGGPVSTPAIDDGVVYALGPYGDLVAVALSSGRTIWRRHLVKELRAVVPHWGFTTSPMVAGDLLIVLAGGADGAVVAFNKKTGETAWRTAPDDASYQSPMLTTIGGSQRILVGGDKWLFALNPIDGQEIWKVEHGGRDFFNMVINPVAVGADEWLLTYKPDESVLLRGADAPKPVWTTRELRGSYTTPVHHQGLLFGMAGGFLTCVDASTGERKWRSRAPGDGFPIIVDGHLVTVTKEGALSVAPAVGDGYLEKASVKVFDRLVWTPPSFAYGRIFVRDSYQSLAAVDVVPAGETTGAAPAVPRGVVPASRFARWVAETEASADPQARVGAFLESQKAFPVIEDDRYAHIVYTGEASEVVVRIDGQDLGKPMPLHRVKGTDMFYASVELAPDARVAYSLTRNLTETIVDPRNPLKGWVLGWGSEGSILLMPRAKPLLSASAGGLRGRIMELEFESPPAAAGHLRWGGKRPVDVYLPPGYDADQGRRYPTVYVMYGKRMREAHLDAAIDRAIGSRLQPTIVVFVQVTSAYEYARTFRTQHRQMLAEALVPWIDARFRTLPEPGHRALVGSFEAGFAALETGVHHPGVFGKIAAQSVYPLSGGGEQLLALIASRPHARQQRFYVDWGRYDLRRDSDEMHLAAYSRRVRDALRARGYDVAGGESNDGAANLFRAARALDGLLAFFPVDTTRR